MSGFSGWAQCLEASPRLCVRWEWEVYYIFSLCNIRHRGGDKLSIAPDVFTTFAFRNTSSASKKTFSYRWQTPKQSRMTGERWAKIILMSLTGSWIMARRWKMKASSSHQEQKRTIKATMSITRILSHRCCLIQKVKVDSLLNIISRSAWFYRLLRFLRGKAGELCRDHTLARCWILTQCSDTPIMVRFLLSLVSWDPASSWLVKCSGVGDYRGAAETQIPTESSGYHSGSLSKSHKSNSGEMSWNILP